MHSISKIILLGYKLILLISILMGYLLVAQNLPHNLTDDEKIDYMELEEILRLQIHLIASYTLLQNLTL